MKAELIYKNRKFFFLCFFVSFCCSLYVFGEQKVLDLGEIEIKGEIRRPNINLIYSKKYINKAMLLGIKEELKKLEKELVKPAKGLRLKGKPKPSKKTIKRQTGSIKDNSQQTGSIKDNSQQTGGIKDNSQQTESIKDNSQQTESIKENSQQTGGIKDNSQQTGGIKDNSQQTDSIKDNSQQTGSIKDNSQQTGSIKDNLKKCEEKQK